MPDIRQEAAEASGLTELQARAYEIGITVLKDYQTEPYGDLRLNAARASAKVMTALHEAGLLADASQVR